MSFKWSTPTGPKDRAERFAYTNEYGITKEERIRRYTEFSESYDEVVRQVVAKSFIFLFVLWFQFLRENGRDLTQSYDINKPLYQQEIKKYIFDYTAIAD